MYIFLPRYCFHVSTVPFRYCIYVMVWCSEAIHFDVRALLSSLGTVQKSSLILGNGLNCFVDGENDEAAQNISSEIALPEVLLESVPQVK